MYSPYLSFGTLVLLAIGSVSSMQVSSSPPKSYSASISSHAWQSCAQHCLKRQGKAAGRSMDPQRICKLNTPSSLVCRAFDVYGLSSQESDDTERDPSSLSFIVSQPMEWYEERTSAIQAYATRFSNFATRKTSVDPIRGNSFLRTTFHTKDPAAKKNNPIAQFSVYDFGNTTFVLVERTGPFDAENSPAFPPWGRKKEWGSIVTTNVFKFSSYPNTRDQIERYLRRSSAPAIKIFREIAERKAKKIIKDISHKLKHNIVVMAISEDPRVREAALMFTVELGIQDALQFKEVNGAEDVSGYVPRIFPYVLRTFDPNQITKKVMGLTYKILPVNSRTTASPLYVLPTPLGKLEYEADFLVIEPEEWVSIRESRLKSEKAADEGASRKNRELERSSQNERMAESIQDLEANGAVIPPSVKEIFLRNNIVPLNINYAD